MTILDDIFSLTSSLRDEIWPSPHYSNKKSRNLLKLKSKLKSKSKPKKKTKTKLKSKLNKKSVKIITGMTP